MRLRALPRRQASVRGDHASCTKLVTRRAQADPFTVDPARARGFVTTASHAALVTGRSRAYDVPPARCEDRRGSRSPVTARARSATPTTSGLRHPTKCGACHNTTQSRGVTCAPADRTLPDATRKFGASLDRREAPGMLAPAAAHSLRTPPTTQLRTPRGHASCVRRSGCHAASRWRRHRHLTDLRRVSSRSRLATANASQEPPDRGSVVGARRVRSRRAPRINAVSRSHVRPATPRSKVSSSRSRRPRRRRARRVTTERRRSS